jgi:hypothetical protein
VVYLDELFGVAGAVVLVNRTKLELVGPGDLPEPGCQSMECAPPCAPPDGVAARTRERRWGDGDLAR